MIRLLTLIPVVALLLTLGACGDGDVEPEERNPEAAEETSSENMREEVMTEQLAAITALRRELTGNWRSDSLDVLLDFESGRYEGPAPYGSALGDYEQVEGEIRVLEEGDDYVTFEVEGARRLTARRLGDDQIIISAEGADDAEGLSLRRR